MSEARRVVRFAIVGALGFAVDAAVLQLLITVVALDPYLARLPSFLSAATATWAVNRHWTFSDRHDADHVGEWGRYVLTMLGGGAINYATYAALLATVPAVMRWPVLGVAAGSLAGMSVNYLAAGRWIFHGTGMPAHRR